MSGYGLTAQPGLPATRGRIRRREISLEKQYKYNPKIHHRRSIRLPGYDYALPGAYFVTICVQHEKYLLGNVADGEVVSNDAGGMVRTVWDEIPSHHPGAGIDAFVVMPNHVHGIIVITDGEDMEEYDGGGTGGASKPGVRPYQIQGIHNRGDRGEHKVRPYEASAGIHSGGTSAAGIRPHGTLPGTVGRIVQGFKSITTHEYTKGVKNRGWPPFPGKLWQRNYWEHIIRDEREWDEIREYIHNNPIRWESDRLHGGWTP
ncbi:MAG: hypothetical protein BECKG1743D_GA0114223_101227 [Candidatus Kentron sp. G]|nr:MAG: hypothetical protein BECKG1743F_GA0114225_102135 [Candidatus Kentron sp. G]VFM98534.1 MAG: hypothetical protein BECKG1743E_GA0114224_101955 [Candidatus Kentron sp. G]VFM99438.1 MAG: hypothetical protein BECKG1743D_GA0114223_101227 [Candidatus Kentron sp. G]